MFVGDVQVEVVLEVLQHVHILLNGLIPTHSWEGKCLVIKFPREDSQLQIRLFLSKLVKNCDRVLKIKRVERPREVVDIALHRIDREVECLCARYLRVGVNGLALSACDSTFANYT